MNILDSDIISKISHLHKSCRFFLQAELNKKGLPDLASSHGYILFLLSKNPGLSMQEIASKINRDKSTTTVLIKKLENLNLVKTSLSPKDSRIKIVSLTDRGAEYNRETQDISNALKEKFFKNFQEKDAENLEKMLDKAAENFL
ncbi:MAG: MarR family transcriptional regulator [Treponema sp.]|uniref:MarR family winged helix-turn-helix transcriptional regulator n=1 Tax=Treponema sp. TaxID=166 RepID=UPI001B686041|nr:MarR family transcriptional regulator [Treponema sp.]MBP5402888.1 MarR family transcriptional regulator [Treponema sp.]MBR5932942.1 MarR family transcriptional regulator [Treponema sp.]